MPTADKTEASKSSGGTRQGLDMAQLRQAANALDASAQDFVGGLLSVLDAVASERDTLASERDTLTNERDALQAEHTRQELRIKQLLILAYGRKTERLSREELKQLLLAFEGTAAQAEQEDPATPAPLRPEQDAGEQQASAPGKPKKKRKRKQRTTVAANVRRVVVEVAVPTEERSCTCCAREMSVIGHVEHETIEYVPAEVVVHVQRREKLGCRHADCRGDIHSAERPNQIEGRPNRRVGTSLLAHLIEAKCHDALPIDRQRDQLKRLGLSMPLNTLYSYWRYATELLMPVAQVTLARVLADDVVGVDDTKLRVLDPSKPKGSYKGCLWCFTAQGPLVAYRFTESWEAQAIAPFIGAIGGFIQCDDYKGYQSEFTLPDGTKQPLVPPERRLGCMMHVRRRFYEALQLQDKRAAKAIEHIKALYEIERLAKEKCRGPDGRIVAAARLRLRAERSVPVLEAFYDWVLDIEPKCTPKSPLGKAVRYAKQQRAFIERCLTDGRFEIDNGRVERDIRKPCIGRNNYLFTGSEAAAQRLAGAYTLTQSARSVGVPIRQYLIDVIDKLEADWPLRRIAELVPDQWAHLHAQGASQTPQTPALHP